MTVCRSGPTQQLLPPSFPKDLGTAGFTVKAFQTTWSLPRAKSPSATASGSFFPPSLEKAAVAAPCTGHNSRVPLLPTFAAPGMEKPLTQPLPGPPAVPLQRDTAVQRDLSLHDNVLQARAHLLYLLVLHCFTPSFLLDLLKTEASRNIQKVSLPWGHFLMILQVISSTAKEGVTCWTRCTKYCHWLFPSRHFTIGFISLPA